MKESVSSFEENITHYPLLTYFQIAGKY